MAFYGGNCPREWNEALEIGGVEDHVHMLLSLASTMPIAKAMQLIKGGSSKWVHETFSDRKLFRWQIKYGAFSVSVSQLNKTDQEEHHMKLSFQESS